LLADSCATLPQPPVALALKPRGNTTLAPDQGPPININKAPAAELEKLPGIGRGLAERIIAHREQYGAFRRAEHLMMVRGISDRKFRALQPMITLE
jgi:competence protein ComEA